MNLKIRIMLDFISQMTDKAAKAVKNWWLLLVAGVLCMAAGVAVFCFPADSYVALSIMFGVIMLVTGVTELVVAVSSRNWFMTRGYNIVGGILDIVVGIMLCAWPQVTMAVLPIFLGIWLIYHSFMIIGLAGDMSAFRVSGSGWLIFGGILLLVLSIMIVLNPFSLGVSIIVALLGVGLIVLGCVLVGSSIRLGRVHRYFRDIRESNGIEEQ